jgi:hypothetical protein
MVYAFHIKYSVGKTKIDMYTYLVAIMIKMKYLVKLFNLSRHYLKTMVSIFSVENIRRLSCPNSQSRWISSGLQCTVHLESNMESPCLTCDMEHAIRGILHLELFMHPKGLLFFFTGPGINPDMIMI